MYDRVICTADIGAEFGDVRPLDEARIRKLSINGGQVLDRIVADSVFLAQLADAGCISWSQREHLINIIQPRDRNEKLTKILTRRSVADFQKFISVLSKEQDFLVPLFLTDGGKIFSVNFSAPRVVQKRKPPIFARDSIHAKRALCYRNSVCLSHGWNSQNG